MDIDLKYGEELTKLSVRLYECVVGVLFELRLSKRNHHFLSKFSFEFGVLGLLSRP